MSEPKSSHRQQSATVGQSIEIAVRHPRTGAALLARTLSLTLAGQPWIDRKAKIQLYINVVRNVIDSEIEKRTDPAMVARLEKMPIGRALQLLAGKEKAGLDIIVTLLAREIRASQSLTQQEEFEFYAELFHNFFPEIPLISIEK